MWHGFSVDWRRSTTAGEKMKRRKAFMKPLRQSGESFRAMKAMHLEIQSGAIIFSWHAIFDEYYRRLNLILLSEPSLSCLLSDA